MRRRRPKRHADFPLNRLPYDDHTPICQIIRKTAAESIKTVPISQLHLRQTPFFRVVVDDVLLSAERASERGRQETIYAIEVSHGY